MDGQLGALKMSFTRKCVIAFLLSMPLWGQSITSRIVGTITDSSGAAIVGASLSARNVETNERSEARSETGGDYLLLNLKPGGYELEVDAPGFRKYVQKGIKLQLEQESRLNIVMQVGQVTEAITVEANVTALETATSTVGTVVNNRAILNLPLDTRNVFSLIYLTPGVSGSISTLR